MVAIFAENSNLQNRCEQRPCSGGFVPVRLRYQHFCFYSSLACERMLPSGTGSVQFYPLQPFQRGKQVIRKRADYWQVRSTPALTR